MKGKKATRASAEKAARKDIADYYRFRKIGSGIKISGPERKSVVIDSCEQGYLNPLLSFAPEGKPTLTSEDILSLVDVRTGRSLQFPAGNLPTIAATMSCFCVATKTETPPADTPAPELPDIIFKPPLAQTPDIPEWIAQNDGFKERLSVDEGDIVLDFTRIKLHPNIKNTVIGRCEQAVSETWGYEVFARTRPFGWVILDSPGVVIITGVSGTSYSKHRNITSAMFRLSSHFKAAMEET